MWQSEARVQVGQAGEGSGRPGFTHVKWSTSSLFRRLSPPFFWPTTTTSCCAFAHRYASAAAAGVARASMVRMAAKPLGLLALLLLFAISLISCGCFGQFYLLTLLRPPLPRRPAHLVPPTPSLCSLPRRFAACLIVYVYKISSQACWLPWNARVGA